MESPARVNGAEIIFPLGLFCIYSDYYVDVAGKLPLVFDYKLEQPHDYNKFIDSYVLRTNSEAVRSPSEVLCARGLHSVS